MPRERERVSVRESVCVCVCVVGDGEWGVIVVGGIIMECCYGSLDRRISSSNVDVDTAASSA